MQDSPEQILKKYFGYDHFRPMQKEIISNILSKNDTVVLMPTGGGKSVCFQVPALCMPGICVVISPLIALMRDQVEALKTNGIEAAFINSSQSAAEQMKIEEACYDGKLKLLYVSPEKLMMQGFSNFLQRLQINLFAIDEAHCISAWGHDFRPEYTKLSALKESFPGIPVVALTATADKVTRKDIADNLKLQNPAVFVSSFDRQNLSLTVLQGTDRFNKILQFLQSRKGQPGIIYCLSRKATEALAGKLFKEGYRAACYHAGLSNDERSAVQDAFLKDNLQIVCATVAFGMGIDKSNVRFVIHYNMPKNIEGFYQEIGRAGRDGSPSDTLLFYTYADMITHREMLLNDTSPERQELTFAKLDRMQQYAEAHTCRRRILLNYFSENTEQDCGNCDVCLNPRKRFDGTVLAQKALSAVARMREQAPMITLIDVLRGMRNSHITLKGYDRIKTYGSGRDLKTDEWREYIQQFIHMGLLEVAYDHKYALHLTPLSKQVLFENKKVELVKADTISAMKQASAEKPKSQKEVNHEKLFDRLRKLRKRLADEENVPPYIIFTDNTLTEMAAERPLSRMDMMGISGVGDRKYDLYGEYFLREIAEFVKEQAQGGSKMKGATQLLTYEAYQKGYSPEQIASQRNLNLVTVYSHLAMLYESGYHIEVTRYITKNEYAEIKRAIEQLNAATNTLKPVHEYFNGRYDYYKIRFAMAIFNRQQKMAQQAEM
jgi:ATP-dependent DNA helicase RecQ